MTGPVTYRWLDGLTCSDGDWAAIDKVLESRGWMAMHRDTSRVLLAEQDGEIVGLSCLQFMPFCGPFFVSPKLRGLCNGVSDRLADDTIGWLVDTRARGWFVVADSPHVPRLCERHGMHRIDAPVYITDAQGQSAQSKSEVA